MEEHKNTLEAVMRRSADFGITSTLRSTSLESKKWSSIGMFTKTRLNLNENKSELYKMQPTRIERSCEKLSWHDRKPIKVNPKIFTLLTKVDPHTSFVSP